MFGLLRRIFRRVDPDLWADERETALALELPPVATIAKPVQIDHDIGGLRSQFGLINADDRRWRRGKPPKLKLGETLITDCDDPTIWQIWPPRKRKSKAKLKTKRKTKSRKKRL